MFKISTTLSDECITPTNHTSADGIEHTWITSNICRRETTVVMRSILDSTGVKYTTALSVPQRRKLMLLGERDSQVIGLPHPNPSYPNTSSILGRGHIMLKPHFVAQAKVNLVVLVPKRRDNLLM